MESKRMDAEARKARIVEAVTPLFARKGFAGTTTKDMAEAAGVSQALIYRYFPNKEAIYKEILLRTPDQTDDGLKRIRSLPPGTDTLIEATEFLVRRFVTSKSSGRERLMNMHRLVLHSLTEDGAFARLVYERIGSEPLKGFEASVQIARDEGHLAPGLVTPRNAFWFIHHLAAQLAYTQFPDNPLVAYKGGEETLIREAVIFLLRGLGMKEGVIKFRYLDRPNLDPL